MVQMLKGIITSCWIILLAVPACAPAADEGTGDDGPRGTKQPGDACADTQECVPNSVCFNEFCVGSGQLRISLGFDADSDFDLHVETPTGNEINFASQSADGGTLDVDQCISSCGSGSHVENVVFSSGAPTGTYTVWVENYDGREAGSFEIEVAGLVDETFSGTLPTTSGATSPRFTFNNGTATSSGSGGSGGSSSSGGSSGGGTGGTGAGGTGAGGTGAGADCESSCPSEFPNDAQLDSFCRSACCYMVTGSTEYAATTCSAGQSLGTADCNYCDL